MKRGISIAAAVLLAACLAWTANAEKKEEFKAKCPISGKPAQKSAAVDYKGGKVYFCCPGCPGAFKKDTAKYAAKANHQLAITGQAKLVKCPVAGRDLNPATAIDVAGVKVCFCCGGCKGKATKVSGDEQIELIFNDKAFAKGFKVAEAKKKKKK